MSTAPPPNETWDYSSLMKFACFYQRVSFQDISNVTFMFKYASYLFLPIALITNTLALLGSVRRAARSPSYLYMTVLAVSDTMVIVTKSVISILIHKKYPITIVGCKVAGFGEHFFVPMSSWVVVLMTADRAVAVTQPLKSYRLCTVRRARLQVSILTAVLFVYNVATTVWIYGGEPNAEGRVNCHPTSRIRELNQAFEIVNRSMQMLIPFIVITALNAAMAATVRKSMRIQATMTQQQKANDTGSRVTIMVVVVSLAFLLTTGPYCFSILVGIGYTTWNEAMSAFMSDCSGPGPAYVMLYFVSHAVLDINYIINFVIYSVTSSQFRKDLVRMICPKHISRRFIQDATTTNGRTRDFSSMPTISMAVSTTGDSLRIKSDSTETLDSKLSS